MKSLISFALIAVIYKAAFANAQEKRANIIIPKFNGDHVVRLDTELRLVCEGTDATTILKWEKLSADGKMVLEDKTDGYLITRTPGDKNTSMKSTLVKAQMTANEEGSYTCYPTTGTVANGDAKTVKPIDIVTNTTVFHIALDEHDATPPVRMTCEVLGITTWKTPIQWKKNDNDFTADDNKRITINGTTTGSLVQFNPAILDDWANYTCVVQVHNNTFEQEVPVFMAPKVKSFDKSKNLVQGDNLRLNCEVDGHPTPSVSWYKDDEPFSTARAEYKDHKGIVNASMTLPGLDFEDHGLYTCVASNMYGVHNATITVRVKDKLAALWPFLGICAEVAILCCIIFIYERRRAKKMEEEEAKEEAGHLTNSHDHKGQEVRQRNK